MTTEVVATPIVSGPVSKTEAEKNYKELLNRSVEAVKSFQGHAAKFYSMIGAEALELSNKMQRYGSRTVETFAKDISERTGTNLSAPTVYYAMRFRTMFTSEQLERVENLGLPWGSIQAMTSKNITPEQRDKILDDVEHGKVLQKDVREKARKLAFGGGGSGGSGGKKGGSADAGEQELTGDYKRFKALPDLILAVAGKMRGTGEALREVFRGSDVDLMKEGKKKLTELEEAVDSVVTIMDHEYRKAREAYEKVKEATEEKSGKAKK